MPRPRKMRRICRLPEHTSFGPLGCAHDADSTVTMTVDEYETIRLIDLEGLSQEQCAEQMHVARTTVQMIYTSARQKLAQSLIIGRPLFIGGGEYCLCEGRSACRRCSSCWKHDAASPNKP